MDSWNISLKDSKYKDFVNRTNNGLERYNHHFQSLFPALASRRPSLIEFVKVAEAESRQQAQELEDIRANRRKIPTYKENTIPEIPKEYHDFKKKLQHTQAKLRKWPF